MSTKELAHETTGGPIGYLMSTLCGAHNCSQRKRGEMSTGVAHEHSRKKTGFADGGRGLLDLGIVLLLGLEHGEAVLHSLDLRLHQGNGHYEREKAT